MYDWAVLRRDGIIERFDPEDPQSFALVDQEGLVEFRLIPNKPGLVPVTIEMSEGDRFHIRLKTRVLLKYPIGPAAKLPHGFQAGENRFPVIVLERGEASTYLYVRPDGSVKLTSRLNGE